jgi:glycosyltransferase involved in cell wall biosynthesis
MSPVATETRTASLVSCVIPTHNRVRMLDQAIRSVLAQTYPHLELILVDDASTDGTYQLCWDWIRKDHRVKYIHNEQPLGGAGARNVGLAAAQGSYIAFLDDDDEWLPDRLSRQVLALEFSGHGFAFSDYLVRGSDGESLRACPMDRVTFDKLSWGNFIGSASAIMIHADIARSVQFDSSLTAAQDYDFYLRVLAQGLDAVRVPHADVLVNEHDGVRITTSGAAKYKGNRRCLLKHVHRFSREQRLFHLYKYRLLEYSNNPRRNWKYLSKALRAYPWWQSRGEIARVAIAVRNHYRMLRAESQ